MEDNTNHQQPKIRGGQQKVLLDPAITAETDTTGSKPEASSGERQDENGTPLHIPHNMEQFRIEVAIDGLGRFYDIRRLGNARYEIAENGEVIGSVQLDEKDHSHCENQGCTIDLPTLKAIREGIQSFEGWSSSAE